MSRVLVVGGGIAGLSVAYQLARRGREVTLFERAPRVGMRSSGVNAGIFRLAVEDPVNVSLAVRSRAIACELRSDGFLAQTGATYACATKAQLERIVAAAGSSGVHVAAEERRPSWLPGEFVLHSPGDGILDLEAMLQGLADAARRHGAAIRCGVTVEGFERSAGRISGVIVQGEHVAGEVVDCSGAWSPLLANGSARQIRPVRRHLYVLENVPAAGVNRILWDLRENVYIRPSADGIWASACDELPMSAVDDVPTDPSVMDVLRAKLARWAPLLAGARIIRSWAGLRPLTPDHHFLVGPDPLEPGLFLCGGFGGHGMTAGLAAGELAAQLLCGASAPAASALAPGRFSA